MTTYINSVKCPECGQDTYELYHEEEVLMCDACRKPEEEKED